MFEINISGEAEQQLTEIAAQNGQNVADYVGGFVEKKLAAGEFVNGDKSKAVNGNGLQNQVQENNADGNPLMKFVGLISSKGDGKTSQNYKQILLDEVDKVHGFGK